MRRRRASLIFAIAALVGVSACGGSPGSQADSTSRTTPSATSATPRTTAPGQGGIDGTEINQLPQVPTRPTPGSVDPTNGQALATFLRSTFSDIQNMWSQEFQKAGVTYVPATLQLFSGSVQTACGAQGSETGPFYCPADRTVFLDQSFFTVMERQFGVTGDFAPAYVVAHEMGHHVQALLGISTNVARADQTDPAGTNSRSVRVELQADCLAGVWAHSMDQRNLLRDGDLASAQKAATAVGDDFLAKTSGQPTEPDNFTHGTSAQRQLWLTTGFEKGIPDACDTFSGQI
jgi:uncharacterized protein